MKEFKKGHRYVFRKSLWMEEDSTKKLKRFINNDALFELMTGWVDESDGKTVKIVYGKGYCDGIYGGMEVVPDWCEEIPVVRDGNVIKFPGGEK